MRSLLITETETKPTLNTDIDQTMPMPKISENGLAFGLLGSVLIVGLFIYLFLVREKLKSIWERRFQHFERTSSDANGRELTPEMLIESWDIMGIEPPRHMRSSNQVPDSFSSL